MVLRICSFDTYAREETDSSNPPQCPLSCLSLDKVRLIGRMHDMLHNARLTHLSLLTIGSLYLEDLCQVLTDHGNTMSHLTIANCEIIDNESIQEGSNGGSRLWRAGQRPSHGAFDQALSACLNLLHLSIEPGNCPVFAPKTLFRPLCKLDSLELNTHSTQAYEFECWFSALGLMPVLSEEKRKLKSASRC